MFWTKCLYTRQTEFIISFSGTSVKCMLPHWSIQFYFFLIREIFFFFFLILRGKNEPNSLFPFLKWSKWQTVAMYVKFWLEKLYMDKYFWLHKFNYGFAKCSVRVLTCTGVVGQPVALRAFCALISSILCAAFTGWVTFYNHR